MQTFFVLYLTFGSHEYYYNQFLNRGRAWRDRVLFYLKKYILALPFYLYSKTIMISYTISHLWVFTYCFHPPPPTTIIFIPIFQTLITNCNTPLLDHVLSWMWWFDIWTCPWWPPRTGHRFSALDVRRNTCRPPSRNTCLWTGWLWIYNSTEWRIPPVA